MIIDTTKYEIALANSGLTVTQAAKRAGVSRGRFNTILNQRNCTPQAVGKIAKGLGVDVMELVDLTENN